MLMMSRIVREIKRGREVPPTSGSEYYPEGS